MSRLVAEIRTSFTSVNNISFSSTTALPYLTAVIEESLRIYPPFVTSNQRLSPPGGATISGYNVPGNVLLSPVRVLAGILISLM
jgi:cytochrome P450